MKVRRLIFGAAFCAATALWSSSAYSQTKDEKKPEAAKPAAATQPPAAKPADKPATATAPAAAKPGDKAPSAEEAKMMEAIMKAATPGPEHAKLNTLVGKWNFITKWRMSPDQPWEETPGKAEYKWALNKKSLYHEVKATPNPEKDAMMGGVPFEGFGMTGFDNVSKKYYNVWADNMGTGIMTSTGTADASGKTFTYGGEYNCPITGGKKTAKSILKIVGDDKVVFEMYDKTPDGKEFISLEVTYARQK